MQVEAAQIDSIHGLELMGKLPPNILIFKMAAESLHHYMMMTMMMMMMMRMSKVRHEEFLDEPYQVRC